MAASARTKRSSSWGAVEGWNSGSSGRAVSVSLQAFHSTTSPIFLFEIIGMKIISFAQSGKKQLLSWNFIESIANKKQGNSAHESQKAGWPNKVIQNLILFGYPPISKHEVGWHSFTSDDPSWKEGLCRKPFLCSGRVSRQQGPWFHMERCYYLSQDPREITLKQTTPSTSECPKLSCVVFVSENPPTAQFIATAFP